MCSRAMRFVDVCIEMYLVSICVSAFLPDMNSSDVGYYYRAMDSNRCPVVPRDVDTVWCRHGDHDGNNVYDGCQPTNYYDYPICL